MANPADKMQSIWLPCEKEKTFKGTRKYKEPTCETKVDKNIIAKLTQTGWGSGFKLPFANPENKQLEELLETKQRDMLALQASITDDKDHFDSLKNNATRLEQSIISFSNLIRAKRAEVQAEESATTFADRLHERQEKENAQIALSLQECQERIKSKYTNFEHQKEVVEDLMHLTEFNGRALQEWIAKTEEGQETIEDINWYKVMDSDMEKTLFVKSQELHSKNREMRNELTGIFVHSFTLRERFNSTAHKFQTLHANRKEVIDQWRRTLDVIQLRDKQIARVGEDYYDVREDMRTLSAGIIDESKFYRNVQEAKKETNFQITQIDRNLQTLRIKLSEAKQMNDELNNEILTTKLTLRGANLDFKKVKKSIEDTEHDISKIQHRVASVEAETIVLSTRLDEIMIDRDDETNNVSTLDYMLNKHEEIGYNFLIELKKLRQFIWERFNEKTELETQLKFKFEHIHNVKSALKKGLEMDTENSNKLAKLKAQLFHVDINERHLDMRISKMQDSTRSTDYILLQGKLSKLKLDEDEALKNNLFLKKESERNRINILRYERHIRIAREESKNVEKTLFNMNLESNAYEKGIKETQKEINHAKIELSLLRLFVLRVEKTLEAENVSITNLTVERMTMNSAIEERKSEINKHVQLSHDIIKSMRKYIEQVSSNLVEIKKNITKQKIKFATISDMMEVPLEEQEEIALVSKAMGKKTENVFCKSLYCVIAQREVLTNAKMEWAGKIKEAETELEGLQNTKKILETSNCVFKHSLAPAQKDSDEFARMQEIETAEKAALVRKHRSRKNQHKLSETLSDLRVSISMTKQHSQSLSFVCNAKMRYASLLSNQLIVQRDKILRWTNLINKAILAMKQVISRRIQTRSNHNIQSNSNSNSHSRTNIFGNDQVKTKSNHSSVVQIQIQPKRKSQSESQNDSKYIRSAIRSRDNSLPESLFSSSYSLGEINFEMDMNMNTMDEEELLKFIELDLKVRFIKEKLEFAVVMMEKFLASQMHAKDFVLNELKKLPPLLYLSKRVEQVGRLGYKNNSRYAQFFQDDPYISFVNDLHSRAQSIQSDEDISLFAKKEKEGQGMRDSLDPLSLLTKVAATLSSKASVSAKTRRSFRKSRAMSRLRSTRSRSITTTTTSDVRSKSSITANSMAGDYGGRSTIASSRKGSIGKSKVAAKK